MHASSSSASHRARLAILALGLALILLVPAAAAEELQIQVRYPELDRALGSLSPAPAGQAEARAAGELFLELRRPGWDLLAEPGAPALPARAEQVVLPPGMTATGVRATSRAAVRLPAPELPPAQPPAILGVQGFEVPAPRTVPPDPAVYSGLAPYPGELAVFRGAGHFADLTVASAEVHPVQFDPTTRELIVHTEIALTFDLVPDPEAATKLGTAPDREMNRIARAIARHTMRGAEGLAETGKGLGAGTASEVDPESYQYVIITTEGQAATYRTLADWKTAKGVPAAVVTTRWIEANHQGRDLPEKMRNFVRQAAEDWGTSYVLLAGDEWLVPSRVSWAFDCQARLLPNENDLYADLYYADLDGNWDLNRNGIFGEVSDHVDLYPDLLVGRVTTTDINQAAALIQKLIRYDQHIDAGQGTETLFFAEVLWHDPYTDGGVGMDMIADRYEGLFPGPITRLYETLGNESSTSVFNALNQGPLLASHDGHALYDIMSCGQGALRNPDVDRLMNGARGFVMFSIGCWSAAFDHDSIAEHFVNNASGGAIAFVGNSRYGWGSPGNPGWGYSDTFASDFFGALLEQDLTELGAALMWPKILRIPYSQDPNVYRWHQYQVNLLGDPEMTCHLTAVAAMTLEAPAELPIGPGTFTATVSDAAGPVAGARLCLAGAEIYAVGTSDETGRVTFAVDVPAATPLTLTATAQNHTYAQSTIIAGDAPHLAITAVRVDDDMNPPSSGNGDGEIARGETVELYLTVENRGGEDCPDLTGTLVAADPYLVLIDDSVQFGDVPGGGAATNTVPLVVRVDGDGPSQAIHLIPIQFSDSDGHGLTTSIPVDVVAPGTRLGEVTAAVVVGNGDRVVDPGETVALTIKVENAGRGQSAPVNAILHVTSPGARVTRATASTANGIGPGEAVELDPPFEVVVDEACSIPACIAFELELDQGTEKRREAAHLVIGEAGILADMEGEDGWTTEDEAELWHRTTTRASSGETSWYCGTAEGRYPNNAECMLQSPEFVVPPDAEVAFWCYFDVTTYGSDGLYLEVRDGEAWRVLYYIGSGGALDPLLFINRWAEHRLPLDLEPGTRTQVRFRFKSDASAVAEGFYVDDVTVSATNAIPVAAPDLGAPLALFAASANPMESGGVWRVALPAATRLEARIYDVNGRLVRDLAGLDAAAGVHELRWNGVTDRGFTAPNGIYFLRVEAGGRQTIRKIAKLPD